MYHLSNIRTFYEKLKEMLKNFVRIRFWMPSNWTVLPLTFAEDTMQLFPIIIIQWSYCDFVIITHHRFHRRGTVAFHRTREQLLLNCGWKWNLDFYFYVSVQHLQWKLFDIQPLARRKEEGIGWSFWRVCGFFDFLGRDGFCGRWQFWVWSSSIFSVFSWSSCFEFLSRGRNF